MTLRSFLLGSVLALSSARALLVVPEVESDAFAFPGDTVSILPLEAQAAQKQQIDLPCTECPFAIQSGDETYLSLEFSIEDGVLLANDHHIFPPAPPSPITAVQRHLTDGEESQPVPLGYAVEMMPLPSPPEEPFDMVAVRFTVLDLDGYPVPLDTVAITLIHDAEGNLFMVKTDIEKTADRASWKKCDGKPKCLRRFMVERIRSMFGAAKERLVGMFKGKGCKGLKGLPPPPFPPRPHHDELDHDFPGHHSPPPPPPPPADHRHSHGKPHHGDWQRTAHRVVRFIVVPAILGVFAGLAASALGMIVGQLAVFMWRRYRRSSPKETLEPGSRDEKQGLMTQSVEELPPAYRDEEAPAEEVADKS
ncbi:hypothetical protein ARAM_004112 [Aspergillus rambellii]|uniref:DUF7728 domain-containing protein n=1 Tax=Aspergillus rambellii TaxID=308745 RepID=A0A0F8X9I0_9EURO|nr:hypothetical protein ARAM_004112 [Aspergillus rambellii]